MPIMASIESRAGADGALTYRLVWREDGRKRSVTYAYRWQAEQAEQALAKGESLPGRDGRDQSPEDRGPRLRAVAERWLAAGRWADSTRKSYRSRLRVILRHAIADMPMSKITKPVVEQFLTESGGSADRRNKVLMIMTMITNYAAETGQGVPLLPIKNEPTMTETAMAISRVQQQHLIDTAQGDMRDMIKIALGAGLRWGEVVGLTIYNLDWTRATPIMRVTNSVSQVSNTLRPYTKGRKQRSVPITADLADVLRRLARRAEAQRHESGLLFVAPDPQHHGGPVRYYRWIDQWIAVRAEAFGDTAWADLRFHDLRHEYATRLVGNLVPITTVQRLLGHANISTTMRYLHVLDDHDAVIAALTDQPASKPRARRLRAVS